MSLSWQLFPFLTEALIAVFPPNCPSCWGEALTDEMKGAGREGSVTERSAVKELVGLRAIRAKAIVRVIVFRFAPMVTRAVKDVLHERLLLAKMTRKF
jgi:hypothetical protein